jgi:hypothetical protein
MMEFGSVSRVKCPACAKVCSHKILFSDGGIEHRLCSECENVGVFACKMVDGKEEGEKKKKWSPIDYATLMERQGSETPNPYSIKNDYTDGDYLSHPKFGDGYVLTVLPPNKMMVMFEDERKMLVCGPGSKTGAAKMTGAKKKSPKKKTTSERAETPTGNEPIKCPRCGATVHPYNISKNPKGKTIGCMHCSEK